MTITVRTNTRPARRIPARSTVRPRTGPTVYSVVVVNVETAETIWAPARRG